MLSDQLVSLARVLRQNPPEPRNAEPLAGLVEQLAADARALESAAGQSPATDVPEPPRAA